MRGGDILVGLADAEAEPGRRVGGLLRVTHQAVARGDGVEQVVWQLWRESGLQDKLLKQVDRGGSLGAQADRDLDAVVALFDAAARHADRLPGQRRGLHGYLGVTDRRRFARAAAPPAEAVALLTAHSAPGASGLSSPSPASRRARRRICGCGGSLGVERLVDLISGVDDDAVSATAPLLAEERRLFYLAMSRAKHTLLVTRYRGMTSSRPASSTSSIRAVPARARP